MTAVDFWTSERRVWQRIDQANRIGAGWNVHVPPARPEHRPLARLEDGGYRPACECGWSHLFTFDNRAEALLRAYGHEEESPATAV